MTSLATLAAHHRAQVVAIDLPDTERQRLDRKSVV